MTIKKLSVGVFFGGRSVEHEISVITALQLIEALDTERFDVVPVYIAQDGKWFSGKALLKKEFYRGLPSCLDQVQEVTLLPKPGVGGLTVVTSKASLLSKVFGKQDETIPVDVVIPAFHGQYGEDGCIQGLLEMADMPYASSDVVSSSVAMNKAICKAVAGYHGVPVLPFALVSKKEVNALGMSAVRSKITGTAGLENFPLFVKPCHLGSSIGISKAKTPEELDAALAGVFKYDELAIIEPCVVDIMEINISVLDTGTGLASVVEIPVGTGGVLSYEDKYLRGGSKKGKLQASQGMAGLSRVIDPQDLDPRIKQSVTDYGLKLSAILGSSGVGRFDFIVDTAKNQIYFNELNPIPGSFSFYLWEKSKPPLVYTQLLNRIIDRAIERKTVLAGYEKSTGFKALFK